jgi:FixJ family two-component response regulator
LRKSNKRKRPTVLVVDDDSSVLRALARLIRAAGFDVQTFEHPDLLLETEVPKTNACLLLDLYMPGLNGVELSAKLAAAGCDLPRIMMTGRDDGQTEHLLEDIKAVAILRKPFDEQSLVNAIMRAVALSNGVAR